MLFTLIFILSVIQSIFGIGLLILGTPLLLLVNLEFIEILSILLPCSMLISFLQIIYSKNKINNSEKKLIFLSLPFIIAGLFFLKFFIVKINFKIFVGVSIQLILLCKLISKKIFINKIFIKYKKIIIILIGIFHSLTNVGGTLLSILFQEIHTNKEKIKANICYAYLFFASIQYLSIRIFFANVRFDIENLYLLIICILGFLIGNKFFSKIKNNLFLLILNLLIFISASSLIFLSFLKF